MTLKSETFEALCSALYMSQFSEFLGEQDVDDEHVAYFHIGEAPKDLRVSIINPLRLEEVRVKIEWLNHFADARNPIKGAQVLSIRTYNADQDKLLEATQQAIVRVLTVYTDVLGETGVAGDINKLADPSPEDFEEDDDLG